MFFPDAVSFQAIAYILIGITYIDIANHYFTKLEKRLVIVHQGHKAFNKPINYEIK